MPANAETIFTDPFDSEHQDARWSWRALVLLILLVLAGTLFPFQFLVHATADRRTQNFLHWLTRYDLPMKGNIANVLFFLPLGFLIAACGRKHKLRALVFAWIVGATLSTAVEYLQSFLPTRGASWWDVFYNTLGSVLGAGLLLAGAWRVVPIARRMEAAFIRWWTLARIVAVFVGFTGVMLFASARLQQATNISSWNANDNLYIGTDAKGKIGSSQRILEFELTDDTLPDANDPAQVGSREVGSSDARPNVLLDLRAENENGLHRVLPASDLIEPLAKTNRFTVQVVCVRPPRGARIWGRVFAFGLGRRLDLSLHAAGVDYWRLGIAEALGGAHHQWQLYFPGHSDASGIERFVITYDGAWLRVWSNGHEANPPLSLNPGGNLILHFKSVDQHNAFGYGMLYDGLIFGPLGCLLGLQNFEGRRRGLQNRVFQLAGFLLPPLALEFLLARIAHRSFNFGYCILELALMGVGFLVFATAETNPSRAVISPPPSQA